MRVPDALSVALALLAVGHASSLVGQADVQEVDFERLQLEAHVDTAPRGVRGVAVITNKSDHALRFGIGSWRCAVALLLYSDSVVRWDQSRITNRRAGGCKWIPQDVELSSGESLTVSSEATTIDAILGDSLPEAQYQARVRVIFARLVPHPDHTGARTTQTDSVVLVPAGYLSVHRPTKDGEPQPRVLGQFAANAPLAMVDQYIPNLERLAFDAGDEDRGIAATIRELDEILNGYGMPHEFEIYEGDHLSGVAERIRTKVLPFFTRTLSFPYP